MIILGRKVRDKVTGFEGIVTGRATYLTGCDQYSRLSATASAPPTWPVRLPVAR